MDDEDSAASGPFYGSMPKSTRELSVNDCGQSRDLTNGGRRMLHTPKPRHRAPAAAPAGEKRAE